jgi:hypothetical protein
MQALEGVGERMEGVGDGGGVEFIRRRSTRRLEVAVRTTLLGTTPQALAALHLCPSRNGQTPDLTHQHNDGTNCLYFANRFLGLFFFIIIKIAFVR